MLKRCPKDSIQLKNVAKLVGFVVAVKLKNILIYAYLAKFTFRLPAEMQFVVKVAMQIPTFFNLIKKN